MGDSGRFETNECLIHRTDLKRRNVGEREKAQKSDAQGNDNSSRGRLVLARKVRMKPWGEKVKKTWREGERKGKGREEREKW